MMSAKPTILVCDDDRLVLATTVAGLRDAGYDVIEADNGDDAILLARQHHPQLALLDIRMDGKSGLDVARYLRDRVGTPFLFVSAFSDEAAVGEARALGAIGYLVKPLDTRDIVHAVQAALSGEGRAATARAAAAAHDAASASRPAPSASAAEAALRLGIALGILMERYAISESDARARLAAWARRKGRAETTVADELVRQTSDLNQTAIR